MMETGSPLILREIYIVQDVSAEVLPLVPPHSRAVEGQKMFMSANWILRERLQWAVKAGGTTPDYGNAIQRDAAGNLFVTGWYSTTAFFGSSNVTTTGGNEVFVARCDSNGTWQWVASGGTPGIDIAYDIAIDDHDNSYITGYTNAGYPVIFGSDTITLVSDYSDVFVAKCDSNGIWQWLSVSGSSSWEVGYGIVIEGCNEYITGYFTLTVDFDSIPLTTSGSNSMHLLENTATALTLPLHFP